MLFVWGESKAAHGICEKSVFDLESHFHAAAALDDVLLTTEGHVKGAEGRMNPHKNTVMYQGEIYYDATEDDCLAALPIHDEYPHNIKFYTPVAKCVPFVFSFLRSLDSK